MSLSYDLAHVTVLDSHDLTPASLIPDSLTARATVSFRQFWQQLSALERADGDSDAVSLPPPTIVLPRENPIPTPKPPTRWEQFVKNKDLKIRKKEKKVFDETTKEWKLRYGYQRGKKSQDDWLMEVPSGTFDDPFEKRDSTKKEQITEQAKRERRNKNRATRAKSAGSASISSKSSLRGVKPGQIKAAVKTASHPTSSASMNQFNKVRNKPAIFEDGSKIPKLFDRNKGRKKSKK
jgi:regulator of ribosome biosynthesis